MEQFESRGQLVNQLSHSMEPLLNEYQLDDIGVYQEEGVEDLYYAGYTIKKEDKVYMIHQPYSKNKNGEISMVDGQWTIQSDDGNYEKKNIGSLEEAFSYIH